MSQVLSPLQPVRIHCANSQKMYNTSNITPGNGDVMATQMNQFSKLESLLDGNIISSKRKTYHCSHIDEMCIVFSETDKTQQVMIPVVVALEWISALESGLINMSMTSRAMREIVTRNSSWAPYQHGFETHLHAILLTWHNSNS